MSKAGVTYDKVGVNSSGNFKITGFDVDAVSKIIGYKYKVYKVYDGTEILVLEEEL